MKVLSVSGALALLVIALFVIHNSAQAVVDAGGEKPTCEKTDKIECGPSRNFFPDITCAAALQKETPCSKEARLCSGEGLSCPVVRGQNCIPHADGGGSQRCKEVNAWNNLERKWKNGAAVISEAHCTLYCRKVIKRLTGI